MPIEAKPQAETTLKITVTPPTTEAEISGLCHDLADALTRLAKVTKERDQAHAKLKAVRIVLLGLNGVRYTVPAETARVREISALIYKAMRE